MKGSLREAEEQRGTEHRAGPMRIDYEGGSRTEVTAKSTMGSTKGLWAIGHMNRGIVTEKEE